jgi:methionine-rich copper-binding protein CopC
LAILLAFLSTGVVAHSDKESITPADGAVIEGVPNTIEIRFNDGMRLTKVEMAHSENSKPETLELGDQSGFEKEFSLPLVSRGTGVYQIEWRGLGVDGHPMNGTFSFEVK